MDSTQIFERLNKIFREIFDDEDIEVGEQTNADDIPDWDSLTHINLVTAVEDEFKIRFELNDLISFKTVGDMVKSIQQQTLK